MVVYLGVICLAFIAGFVHSPMVVANSWFIRHRARAMTVVSAAVPIGGALISPLLAVGVASVGWRWAAFASGCIFLLVCLPLSFQLKRSPESMGLLPDGEIAPIEATATSSADKAAGSNSIVDFTSRQAMKTWVFWLLVISMTARVTCYSTATVHFIPLMVWKGLSEGAAATLLGAFASINLLAHFLLGWIADRVNKPKLLAACHLLRRFLCRRFSWTQVTGNSCCSRLRSLFWMRRSPSSGPRWEISLAGAISPRSEV